jgi:hypothetical protein
MIQIFFISPNGASVVRDALKDIPGHQPHGWRPDGDDKQVIGVVNVHAGDPDRVAEALEAAGIHVLPDHKGTETIAPEHHERLKRHGVLPTDTTKLAMHKVHGIAGFPPIKPKRF